MWDSNRGVGNTVPQLGTASGSKELQNVLTNYTEAGEFKLRLSCGRLGATIEKFPDMVEKYTLLFQKVGERMKKLTRADGAGAGIIHGDIWPGNLVFASTAKSVENDAAITNGHTPLDKTQFIYVLDWELCHLSSFVVDLGTLFAELYFLYFFKGSTSVPLILDSFLEAYGPIKTQDALNIMIYFGVHLIIWPPRTEWSVYPRMKECVQFGCDVVENAHGGNSEYFKTGFFQKVFKA